MRAALLTDIDMSPTKLLKQVLPPFVTTLLRRMRQSIGTREGLTYAPRGWGTPVPDSGRHESRAIVEGDLREWKDVWEPFSRQSTGRPWITLPESGTQIEDLYGWMRYAYVLSQAARGKRNLRILDYGGGLGHLYLIARTALPGITMDYHCKEMPALACEGRRLNPEVIWHIDDSCLGQEHDLVILSSVLQYVEDWKSLLRQACAATRAYLYIADTPVGQNSPTFVAIQNLNGTSFPFHQFNAAELESVALDTGMVPVHEFPLSVHRPIRNAPEQPAYYSCLFRRNADQA